MPLGFVRGRGGDAGTPLRTPLASLLLRFHDVDSGSVLVDGIDVRRVTQGSLRRHIGLVPQDPFLFSGGTVAGFPSRAWAGDSAARPRTRPEANES